MKTPSHPLDPEVEALYFKVRKAAQRFAERCHYQRAEDEFQSAALIALLNARRTYQPGRGSSFSTWAWQYVKGSFHRTLETQRNRKRLAPTCSLEQLLDGEDVEGVSWEDLFPDSTPTPEENYVGSALLEYTDQLLLSLPSLHAHAFRGYLDSGSYTDVAKEMGLSRQAVANYCQRTVQELRPHLIPILHHR